MAKSEKVKTTSDLMFELAKPFDRKEIECRVQRTTKDGTAGLALAYVNARTVQIRLDIVMGATAIVASVALKCGDSSIVLNKTSAHA